MNRLPIEVENDILAENLREVEQALAQAVHALGINESGYVGQAPNRYHVYASNDNCTEFTAIHVDEDGKRIHEEESVK